ncbi:CopZ family metallochaperone [Acidithiobacillus ferrooxidans]|uniref:CopZ family metallochaperone n=1 Tax=Acidithiobacillus ferrooxidans TaxID=920 RepID=UPI000A7B0EC4
MSEIKLEVTGMTCQHCVRAVTQALESTPGVDKAEVDLKSGTAVVHGQAEPDKLIAAIKEEGYDAKMQGGDLSYVLLYTSPGCPDCAAVKRYLEGHGIAYEERDVTAPGVAEEAKSRYGVRVAPITVVNGDVLYGTFAEQKPRLDAAFGG